jgi:hypothetical protein
MQGNAARLPEKSRFMSAKALKSEHKPLNWPFFAELTL